MAKFSLGKLGNIFKRRKRQEKASRTSRLLVTSAGGGAVYSDKDYENFSNETYLKNVIAYRCIQEIARNASTPTWQLNQGTPGGKSTIVENHEIVDLLSRPNPEESWNFFVFKAISYLTLVGNSFLERVMLQTTQSEYPKELYVLRPDRIKINLNTATGQVSSYEYSIGGGQGTTYEVDPITNQSDILHLLLFHPTNDFWGASPVEPASRSIDSNNEALDWNQNLLRNQGRPGMIIKLLGDVGDEEFERFERHLSEKFTGPDNVGKNLILTGETGTDAKAYSFTPAEMEFIEGNRELARDIARAWGVPPMLLGIPGDSTYSNVESARLALWEETVAFYLNLLVGELNNWLFTKESGLFLSYNTDNISALEPRWESKWKRAQNSDFLSINEKRQLAGYENWGKAGDVILVNASQIPLGMAGMDDGEEKGLMLSKQEQDIILGLRGIDYK